MGVGKIMVGIDCLKVIGVKQTLKKINCRNVQYVCVAKDANPEIVKPVIEKCNILGLQLKILETMNELGKVCDIDVGAAAALFLEK